MIYRTLTEALDEKRPAASWKEKVIVPVRLADGREFFRTYVFDASRDKCKRCRGARNPGRLASRPGHHNDCCVSCGNPYFHFVRESRRMISTGRYERIPYLMADTGLLH